MPARILIFDGIAANRILLRALLEAAQYKVSAAATASEARLMYAAARPDLIVVDLGGAPMAGLAFVADLRSIRSVRPVPVIGLCGAAEPALRLRALQAGVDDLCQRPLPPALLQAQIRRLLRRRDLIDDLTLKEETHRALGLAEDEGGNPLQRTGKVAILTSGDGTDLHPAVAALRDRLPGSIQFVDPADLFADFAAVSDPDLFLVDAAGGGLRPGELFRLVSELRSRSATRHVAQMAVLPPSTPDMAAMALDLGVDDLVTSEVQVEELEHRVRALLSLKARTDLTRDALRQGIEAAVTDPLTGLYNRRYALPHLAAMAERARRTGGKMGVMILDIDHFKEINDSHGHAAGDCILAEVARRLAERLREGDLVARIGGEEFLVAMPDTTQEEASLAAERLRSCIEGRPFYAPDGRRTGPRPAPPIRVTLSIGVAVGRDDLPGRATLFDRADAALYEAKTHGRNKVTMDRSAA